MVRTRLRGASLVEGAVVLPVVMSLLMLVSGASLMWRARMCADSAAAEGARYATLHPTADDYEVASWVRAQAGDQAATQLSVTVSASPLADQDYEMRVLGEDGGWLAADARTTRELVTVTVSMPVTPVGGASWTATATHSGVRSTEGVAR